MPSRGGILVLPDKENTKNKLKTSLNLAPFGHTPLKNTQKPQKLNCPGFPCKQKYVFIRFLFYNYFYFFLK
jgi:hypothetical protein